MTQAEAFADREFWGRLTESAVGAHLINASAGGACEVFYWRERNREVDFVLRKGKKLVAIEVKSGRTTTSLPGMESFSKSFKPDRRLIVGPGGISLERVSLNTCGILAKSSRTIIYLCPSADNIHLRPSASSADSSADKTGTT